MSFFTILRNPDKIQIVSGNYKNRHACYLENQSDVSVDFVSGKDSLKVMVTGHKTPISVIKCRWYGAMEEGTMFMGDAIERAAGDLQFQGLRPERLMPWYFFATFQGQNAGYGVKVRPDTFVFWQVDSSGITLWLDFRCGTSGYALEGKTILAAELVEAQENGDLFTFMCNFCQKMKDHPLVPQNPVYGFNNWYYAYGKSSQDEILADTALLRELCEGIENRPYMVIDAGWGDGSTVGTKSNPDFPDMEDLAGRIKAQNIHPGIWIRPLKVLPDQYPDFRLEHVENRLDPSLDETLDIVASDMERITGQWGYDLVKYDFVTYDIFEKLIFQPSVQLSKGDWRLKNPMTNAQAIKRLYKTIYDHSNGALLIGCNCIGHLASGYIHLHRSGDDTSGKEWERNRYYGINSLAFRLCQHKAFYAIDADCVGCLGEPEFTWDVARKWLELLTDSSTPLFVSIAPKAVNASSKKDLKEAFARASRQDGSCKPLDLTRTTMPERWEINGAVKEYQFNGPMGAEVTLD